MKARIAIFTLALGGAATAWTLLSGGSETQLGSAEGAASDTTQQSEDAQREAGLVAARLGYQVGDVVDFALDAKFELTVGAANDAGDVAADLAWTATWQ